ncbi:MAG TPA: 3-deoxy-manno-octulosonate cytidylyltransferase [Thermodesulfobacteriota bacterium]|nr:3-deoxy-manno-octulosonate cytidylyltransferase [Thermodesulfobacteriota bacterium]
MTVLAVIPARYASSRFPGKPLAPLSGRPMIQWVYERARRARLVDDVLVATDDERIAEAVGRFGGRAVRTQAAHPSGTDRIAEVVRGLGAAAPDVIVNVQGDQPLLEPSAIDRAVAPLLEDPAVEMATLATPLADPRDVADPNRVKVVTDLAGFALYFSRAPVPYRRDGHAAGSGEGGPRAVKHIGLYVYRRPTLLRLASLAPTPLERAESLEQLRALEHGIRIKVVMVEADCPEVDTPEDLARVEAAVAAGGAG